jgi:hypothetical protein
LAKHQESLPQPGSIIASSFTSPLDCLYLAAIFDPVFTASYPNTRRVQQISLFQAIFRALASPQPYAPHGARLVTLASLKRKYPQSLIVLLPECTASNGRGILTFSPSLLTASPNTKIYPVSLRYSPSDVTTPLPGSYISFFWDLLSRPTHTIRVRIAEAIPMPDSGQSNGISDQVDGPSDERRYSISNEEQEVLDQVAGDLARLGRSKRVGLGVQDKVEFLKLWTKTRRIW